MKRNNKDNSGYGKSANKSGNRNNERSESESRSSSGRFFDNRHDKSEKSGRPSSDKPRTDWNNKSERNQKPASGSYGRGRSERGDEGKSSYRKSSTERNDNRFESGSKGRFKPFDDEKSDRKHGSKSPYSKQNTGSGSRPDSRSKPPFNKFDESRSDKPRGRKPGYGKPYPKRDERPSEDRRASYRFGSEWAEKPREDKARESNSNSERGDRASYGRKSPDNDFNKDKSDTRNPADFKTIYKGRGKDQKPRYETVRKEEIQQKKPAKKFFSKGREELGKGSSTAKPEYNFKKYEKDLKKNEANDEIRLNKYIANAGVCSRREADTLIENGLISVNGTVVKELGHKVSRTDNVQYQGKVLNPEKPVYLLLNKPKDFITTTDDPMERKTVMSLVNQACEERIFPVGRLDRNTTGLLFFTNDGELADKLASPANKIKKIYQVTLDKPLAKNDADLISEGLTLEDGLVEVDDIQVLSLDRTILGLEIHIGRNRIVRRIFAHLGYDVIALDRVVYAGLNKKDIPRGNYRFLSEKEVINLKYFS